MDIIIDPISGNKCSIWNKDGRELLKLYIKNYSNGGGCDQCDAADASRKKTIKKIIDTIKNVATPTLSKYKENFKRIHGDTVIFGKPLFNKKPQCKKHPDQ